MPEYFLEFCSVICIIPFSISFIIMSFSCISLRLVFVLVVISIFFSFKLELQRFSKTVLNSLYQILYGKRLVGWLDFMAYQPL